MKTVEQLFEKPCDVSDLIQPGDHIDIRVTLDKDEEPISAEILLGDIRCELLEGINLEIIGG